MTIDTSVATAVVLLVLVALVLGLVWALVEREFLSNLSSG